jgi:non-heme chloroperoxidase
MPFLELQDETELYFNDWGAGSPIILIHGWPLSGDMWEHQAAFLVSNGYRVITYDRRGFGQSTKSWSGHDYDTLAGDLAQLIDALDLEDVTLVGFSMGGGEVVRYLSLYGSARVSKAVLISSVTPFMLKTAGNPDGTPEETFDGFHKSILKDRFDFLNTFGPQFYGRSALNHTVSDAVLNWTFALGSMASPRATLEDLTAFSTTDFR